MNTKTPIQTIDPEIEPEYVGAHSGAFADTCAEWHGEYEEDLSACEQAATHTVVMKTDDGLHEVPMCDDCGEPQDVTSVEREWSA